MRQNNMLFKVSGALADYFNLKFLEAVKVKGEQEVLAKPVSIRAFLERYQNHVFIRIMVVVLILCQMFGVQFQIGTQSLSLERFCLYNLVGGCL